MDDLVLSYSETDSDHVLLARFVPAPCSRLYVVACLFVHESFAPGCKWLCICVLQLALEQLNRLLKGS